MVEHPPEPGRRNPAEQSRACREAPIGTDQMFAPGGHWRTYRLLGIAWQAPVPTLPDQRFTVN
jgi:hypothetical protein